MILIERGIEGEIIDKMRLEISKTLNKSKPDFDKRKHLRGIHRECMYYI